MIRSWHPKGWNLLEFAYKILQLSQNHFVVSLGQNTRDFERKYELLSFVNYFELLSRNQMHFFPWLVLDNFIESIFISKQKICASKKIMIKQKTKKKTKQKKLSNSATGHWVFIYKSIHWKNSFHRIFSVKFQRIYQFQLFIRKKSHSAKLCPEGVLRRPPKIYWHL